MKNPLIKFLCLRYYRKLSGDVYFEKLEKTVFKSAIGLCFGYSVSTPNVALSRRVQVLPRLLCSLSEECPWESVKTFLHSGI